MVVKSKKAGRKTSRKPAKKAVKAKPKKKVTKKTAKPKRKTLKKPKKAAKKITKKKIKLPKKFPIVSQAAVIKTEKRKEVKNVIAEKYYRQYKSALEEVYSYFEQEMEARQNGDAKRMEHMKEAGYQAQERADEAYGKFLKAKIRDD
ncbi:MAG: hypothetical protein JXA43_00115 [Candidatus Diapherotrites archaeon]|nr:hypothetical protein [Candidatus Diapherotrites archaeon]